MSNFYFSYYINENGIFPSQYSAIANIQFNFPRFVLVVNVFCCPYCYIVMNNHFRLHFSYLTSANNLISINFNNIFHYFIQFILYCVCTNNILHTMTKFTHALQLYFQQKGQQFKLKLEKQTWNSSNQFEMNSLQFQYYILLRIIMKFTLKLFYHINQIKNDVQNQCNFIDKIWKLKSHKCITCLFAIFSYAIRTPCDYLFNNIDHQPADRLRECWLVSSACAKPKFLGVTMNHSFEKC